MFDLELRGVTKRYGNVLAVNSVDLEVRQGELVSLLGPSGCGKTTILRMVTGFLGSDEGEILIRGRLTNRMPSHKRDIAMVYQNYALFPHMTVGENVAFGLRMRNYPTSEIHRKVAEALDLVHLSGMENRYPTQLSGGQQQRVALARAIVVRPAVLLLDEPLSNLDAKLRLKVRSEIRELQLKLGITTIFVTHDQEEALSVSDRIVVMHKGQVEQIGTPGEIYENPASLFVMNFVGSINVLKGRVVDCIKDHLLVRVARDLQITAMAGHTVLSQKLSSRRGDVVLVGIRPEKVMLLRELSKAESSGLTPHNNTLAGTIFEATYLGAMTHVRIRIDEDIMITALTQNVSRTASEWLAPGKPAFVSWNPTCSILLPNAEGDKDTQASVQDENDALEDL